MSASSILNGHRRDGLELYVAVHHVATPPAGTLIILGTQACLPGNWVMGPKSPATHAFVVVRDQNGMGWRLDGQPGGARWSPWDSWGGPPTAAWQIVPSPHRDMHRAATRARALSGTPYDWAEIGQQAAAAFAKLPFPKRVIHGLGPGADALKGAMICTRVCTEVLGAVGSEIRASLGGLPDLFPESLAQHLTRVPWAKPVYGVGPG